MSYAPSPELRECCIAARKGDQNAARQILRLYGYAQIAKEIKKGKPFSNRVRRAVNCLTAGYGSETWEIINEDGSNRKPAAVAGSAASVVVLARRLTAPKTHRHAQAGTEHAMYEMRASSSSTICRHSCTRSRPTKYLSEPMAATICAIWLIGRQVAQQG